MSKPLYSILALSWDAMVSIKKVKLELIRMLTCTCSLRKVWEVEFLIFFERYRKVNIKYGQSFDPKQEIKHIYITMVKLCLKFFQQVESNG